MTNAKNWRIGNAQTDGADRRGWFVGHFIDPEDIRMSKDVEIKWGAHQAGEERPVWQTDEYRTTVLLLISGRFRINLSVDSYILKNDGDYAIWGPGIDHSWKAEEDSVVITIRWPSLQQSVLLHRLDGTMAMAALCSVDRGGSPLPLEGWSSR